MFVVGEAHGTSAALQSCHGRQSPACPTPSRLRLRAAAARARLRESTTAGSATAAATIAGPFREFELDVTDAVSGCATNALAVKVAAPEVRNLAWNWVDWAPFPPDKNQGLLRPVTVFSTGPVRLRSPHVITR